MEKKHDFEGSIQSIINEIRLDCSDRRGIKNGFEDLDDDIEEEINGKWSEIIEKHLSQELIAVLERAKAESYPMQTHSDFCKDVVDVEDIHTLIAELRG